MGMTGHRRRWIGLALAVLTACILSAGAPTRLAYGKTVKNVTISLASSSRLSSFTGKHNIKVSYDTSRRAIRLQTTGKADPYVTLNVSKLATVSASTHKYVVINYVAPTGSATAGGTQLFWKLGSKAYAESRSTCFNVVRGSGAHSKIIDLSRQSYWSGTLTALRFDPFESGLHAGDSLYVSSVVFCATQQQAKAACTGSTSGTGQGTSGSGTTGTKTGTTQPASDPTRVDVTFDKANVTRYFSGTHSLGVAYDASARAVRLMTTGKDDPYVTCLLSAAAGRSGFATSTYRYAVVRYRLPATNANATEVGQLFWRINNAAYAEGRSSSFLVSRADGECVQVVDLSELGAGNITNVRIDPFSGAPAGEIMYLRSVTFAKDASTAAQAAGTTSYTTSSGVRYAASGQASGNGSSGYRFAHGMSIALEMPRNAAAFNRMSFTYTASTPLRMAVVYGEGKSLSTDTFYLEAGTNLTFGALLSSYLAGGRATSVRQLCLTPLKAETATFSLRNLTTSMVPLYTKNMVYLENGRFKLGIDLGYGGAISYLKDKSCPVSGIDSLVNRYDAGRLVQQSYYGAVSGEGYQSGAAFDAQWCYNPVQGGDQYNNRSRIVDVQVTSDRIYVRAQPQDWSLDGQITPSYMENTYTLRGDLVRVDNRFTDYSGMDHPGIMQELPALFTLAYLNRFSYYEGTRAWRGERLTNHDNLPFWGGVGNASGRFFLSRASTERWCAWTATDRDYGIGLKVGVADFFHAGRMYGDGRTGRTKSATDVATSYVAPRKVCALRSFEPLGHSYYLTAGSLSSIGTAFGSASLAPGDTYGCLARNEATTASLDFSQSASVGVLSGLKDFSCSYNKGQAAAKLVAQKSSDPYVHIDIRGAGEVLMADDFSQLRLTYMIPTGNSKRQYAAELYLCAGDESDAVEGHSVRRTLVADGRYHTETIGLRGLSFWKGVVNKIRLDLFDTARKGDTIYLREVALVP